MQEPEKAKYWSTPSAAVLNNLRSTPAGLTAEEAAARFKEYGENTIREQKKSTPLLLFLSQFKNPIILILLIATGISAATGDWNDSLIILAIILGSSVLSFLQEYSAGNAVKELRSKIQIKSTVLRNGKPSEIPSSMVVPGDIITLSAGSLIPADGLILECHDFFVNQSILTGEAFPVEKKAETSPEDATLAERRNCVFMGTSVRSGIGHAGCTNRSKHRIRTDCQKPYAAPAGDGV
jgi:Mg2+-importing ATPase